jgi:hypothetical protein
MTALALLNEQADDEQLSVAPESSRSRPRCGGSRGQLHVMARVRIVTAKARPSTRSSNGSSTAMESGRVRPPSGVSRSTGRREIRRPTAALLGRGATAVRWSQQRARVR